MDPQQLQSFEDSIQYCHILLSNLEREKDTIRSSFHGEPLQAYLEATDLAILRTKQLREMLQNLKMLQP